MEFRGGDRRLQSEVDLKEQGGREMGFRRRNTTLCRSFTTKKKRVINGVIVSQHKGNKEGNKLEK